MHVVLGNLSIKKYKNKRGLVSFDLNQDTFMSKATHSSLTRISSILTSINLFQILSGNALSKAGQDRQPDSSRAESEIRI